MITIRLSGPCFEVESKGPVQHYCPNKPELHQLPLNFFNDDDIEEFLMNAGLEDTQPERAPINDYMSPITRRRWVLGDVPDGEWLQNKQHQEERKKANAARSQARVLISGEFSAARGIDIWCSS